MAGQQLLVYNLFDSGSPTRHESFFSQIRALNSGHGYPRLSDNAGVSFGAPDPNPNPGGRWARFDVNGLCNVFEYGWETCDDRDYFVEDDHAQAGSYLPLDITRLWGLRASGLARFELLRYDPVNPTCIPYASALDIVGGVSPFDPPLLHLSSGETPSFHDVVPEDLVAPMLTRLGYEVPPPSSVSISGPSTLSAGENGYWRASTPVAGASYEYHWEYRITFSSCGGGGGFGAGTESQGGPRFTEAPAVRYPRRSPVASGTTGLAAAPCSGTRARGASGSISASELSAAVGAS